MEFPLSWKNLFVNILTAIVFIWKMVMSREVAAFNKYRNAHGLPGRFNRLALITRAAHVICPAVRETELPMHIPGYLGLYGPIVLDTAPVEVSDPELNRWLDGKKTVLMCMGTHFHYTESQVKAVIRGFLAAVGRDSDTQLLWKLSDKKKFEKLIGEALKDPKDKERFKIVDWLDADPASILKHPNLIAWIHHGGANSYYEGAL